MFFLDQRSFRSAKASQGGVCDNPRRPGGARPGADRAAVDPQHVRGARSVARPAGAQACKDRINDPGRTMLGKRQLAAFKRDIQRSTATLKVDHERDADPAVLRAAVRPLGGLRGRAPGVLKFLRERGERRLPHHRHARELHQRRSAADAGGGRSGELRHPEVITGPVATKTFGEIDDATGRAGSGVAITRAFFKPPPPNGVGMSARRPTCSPMGRSR